MSINRLFETIYYLIEHKQTTAKELAEHFEVSTRTIYRDLDRLIVAGFPIYANQGAKGGIYIDSEFVLDKMTFSDDEQNQILMALQCIERLQDRDEAGLIDKMAALFNKNKLDWIEVDFTTWHYNNSQNEKFETIKKLFLNKRKLNLNILILMVRNHSDVFFQINCFLKQILGIYKDIVFKKIAIVFFG